MKISARGIELEVEDQGPPGAPPVLLIMGLGMQLTAWPQHFVQPLLDAGLRVIRFDNRDAGLSQHFDHLGRPSMAGLLARRALGLRPAPPYTLHEMALDALGLLDALGVASAHVVGASMGGMIAQRLALAAPERVRSLSSLMSSSGAAGLPGAAWPLRLALMRPPAACAEQALPGLLRLHRLIGSPAFPADPARLREQLAAALRRAYHPAGTARQLQAVLCDDTRADELGAIRAPTLVLHGRQDPLLPLACGQDTQRRIPGARLVSIEGMGHDLPPEATALLMAALLCHVRAC